MIFICAKQIFLKLLLTILCLDDAVADFFLSSSFTLMFAIIFLSDFSACGRNRFDVLIAKSS